MASRHVEADVPVKEKSQKYLNYISCHRIMVNDAMPFASSATDEAFI